MTRTLSAFAALAAAGFLAGCVEDNGVATAPGNSVEAQARTNCVGAVRAQTGNPNISVVSSSFSEAGTEVILRVGPTGTWRCIGYRDGSTGGIMSMTNEGFL